jgi:hypothetical protein
MLRLALILIASVLTIGFNIYAVSAPLYGVLTQEVSAENEVLFTPSGSTFAIWGIIYLGLISFSLYAIFAGQAKSEVLKKATPWYLLAAAANVIWLHFWHSRQIELSVVLMVVLLFSLIKVYSELKIGQHKHSWVRALLFNAPISIYLGWISVATIANVAIVLDKNEWNGFGVAPVTWTAIMIVIAGALGIYMQIKRGDFGYAAVILWGLFGIYTVRSEITLIANATTLMGLIILAAMVVTLLRMFLPKVSTSKKS